MDVSSKTTLENHAFRKLAHLMVGGNEVEIVENAHSFIVEQALLEVKNGVSIKEIRLKIQNLFSLKFRNEEIEQALKRLITQKNLNESNSRYSLTRERTNELIKNNHEIKEVEKQIYQDWIDELSIRYPELTTEEKRLLSQDLRIYINHLFLRNGAECSIFIDRNKNLPAIEQKILYTEKIFNSLPTRDVKLETLRKIEFPSFLKDADIKKRNYFSSLLDGTFIYNIIQVDVQTLSILRNNLKKYVFYIDTNILYSLFNLRGKNNENVIEKTFNLAKTFGIKFLISSKTLEEMRFSIQSKSEKLLNSPDIRRDLGEIGADISEEENFITAYWRAYSQTGINKKDFISKYSHLSDLVKSKGILIDNTEFNPQKLDLENEKHALNSTIIAKKPKEIANHDAYQKLLIEHLRNKNDNKSYWFLTLDNQIAYYSIKTKKGTGVPFAFLPHQLLQILRLFEKRTDDYDGTFLELFTKPQIKSAKDVIPNDYAEKILSKISGYSDIPKELAVKIIVDSKFIESVFKNENESEQDTEIKKRIELEVNNRLKEVTERLNILEMEKKEVDTIKPSEINSKNKMIENQKTIILILSLIIFIVISILLAMKYWNGLNITSRAIVSIFSISTMICIFRIKFKFPKIFEIINNISAVLSLVILLIYVNLPTSDSTDIIDGGSASSTTPTLSE